MQEDSLVYFPEQEVFTDRYRRAIGTRQNDQHVEEKTLQIMIRLLAGKTVTVNYSREVPEIVYNEYIQYVMKTIGIPAAITTQMNRTSIIDRLDSALLEVRVTL